MRFLATSPMLTIPRRAPSATTGACRTRRSVIMRMTSSSEVSSVTGSRKVSRLRGFLRTVDDRRGRQGRSYPLEYLLALPLIAGMAGDGELDAAAEWAATAPEELLVRLGASLGRNGKARRPDATTLGRARAAPTRASTTTRCARGPLPGPVRRDLVCAATCGSTGKRCAAPPAAGMPRCCCRGSGTTAPPPPSSRSTSGRQTRQTRSCVADAEEEPV
jgi:hypothetical protein